MNFGVAPVYATAFAVAANVNDETSTSSPGPTSWHSNARWSAAVPLDIATVPGHPVNAARSASNASSSGPTGATQPLSNARSSASRSSGPTSGELSRMRSTSATVSGRPAGRTRREREIGVQCRRAVSHGWRSYSPSTRGWVDGPSTPTSVRPSVSTTDTVSCSSITIGWGRTASE